MNELEGYDLYSGNVFVRRQREAINDNNLTGLPRKNLNSAELFPEKHSKKYLHTVLREV